MRLGSILRWAASARTTAMMKERLVTSEVPANVSVKESGGCWDPSIARRAVTRPLDFFLMNIELRKKACLASRRVWGGRRRRLAYLVSCLSVSFDMAAAISEAGRVHEARPIDISVLWAGMGTGMVEEGWLLSCEGCWALNRRLRNAAERALASLVVYDWCEARKLEPCQWPGGRGFAAIRAEDRGIGGGAGGSGIGDGV